MATDMYSPAAPLGDTNAAHGSRLGDIPTRLFGYFQPQRRRALALVMLLAGLLDFWDLQRNGYANTYYAAAVKSMLQSWHNFFFVSFDPGGFVTVDKPPLGFWIQTASAKLFGFSGFSILLPEALAGALSVGVIYLIVRRIFNPAAGLLAALALAVTPISVVTNRNNTIDSLLVLTALLAAYAVTRATEHGSLRWLLLGALLVGLGFNIKMLEAYLIVPALAAAYLLTAPLSWRARLGHLALAGLLMLVISLSWVTIVDLIPTSARPYVGSSSTNSELELALGYNGIERLTGSISQFIGGGASTAASGVTTTVNNGPGGVSENGQPGFFRLLDAQLGGQASWLLALGAVGLLAGGWSMRPLSWLRVAPQRMRDWLASAEARRVSHLSAQQGAWVLWGLWTLTQAVFFSVAGFFHTYYLSMLAPGVAALAGIGAVELWHNYHHTGWRIWLLPAALVFTALIQAVILSHFPTWSYWMTPLTVVGSLVAAGALVWLRLRERRAEAAPALVVDADGRVVVESAPHAGAARWQALAMSLGLTALLVGPLVWTGISLASGTGGAGGALPSAGPRATTSFGGGALANRAGGFERPAFANGAFPAAPAGGFGNGAFAGGPPPGVAAGGATDAGGAGGDTLQVNSALVSYLLAHQGSARYLLATSNANSAAPYILATGKPVMALGGFLGSDPILTP